MVMIVAAAAVLVVMVVLMLLVELCHQLLCQGGAASHGGQDLVAGQVVPGGGDDDGVGVLLLHQSDDLLELLLLHVLGAAEDDGAGVLDLVVEELTKVLHVHLALLGVDHGHRAAQLHFALLGHVADGLGYVGELAHAGGLDEDAVGVILLQHLPQSLAEVAHQGTADTAGVHLGDLDAGVLEETAVNADLTKFIFNQNDLLAGEGFRQQFFDQRGLPSAQKAGDNINGCHKGYLASHNKRFTFYCTLNAGKSKGKIRFMDSFYKTSARKKKGSAAQIQLTLAVCRKGITVPARPSTLPNRRPSPPG